MPSLALLAWRARNKRAASIVAFVGSLVVISPQILLAWEIIAARGGGDGQAGLGLQVIPLIQWVVVGVVRLAVWIVSRC